MYFVGNIFKLPASAWGMLAGTIAGLTFSVLMTIAQSDSPFVDSEWLWMSFIAFLFSATFFAAVSVVIEQERSKKDLEDFFQSLSLGADLYSKLTILSGIGFAALTFGFVALFAA